jgi:hypothetical protein
MDDEIWWSNTLGMTDFYGLRQLRALVDEEVDKQRRVMFMVAL